MYSKDDLINLKPNFEFFVGIDSDGCVFDSMGVKQRDHFHPIIIEHWGLQKIEKQLRAAAEFANLYSQWRGMNRFIDLLKTFDLLAEWDEVQASGVELPRTDALRAYVNSGLPLGNPSLIEEVKRTSDPDLEHLLEWSLAVNKSIDETMEEVPPFPYVLDCLKKMETTADRIVVSQTPEEALVKEWKLHKIDHFVPVIAGQELGTKTEHLQMATGGKYKPENVLMIGDAPGDRKAAESVGACFYPINPAGEVESWKRLLEEGLEKFYAGEFLGTYQQELNEAFEAKLPEKAPWEN